MDSQTTCVNPSKRDRARVKEIAMASNKGGWLYLFLAGPILIGAAYSISALLTADNAAGEKDPSELSLAFDLLMWVGAPIAIVATLPLLAGIIKTLKKP